MNIDEPVELAEPRVDWPALFESEAAAIRCALAGSAVAVEHIGSTAVAGLLAKPIIDIQVGIEDDADVGPASDALVRLGYEALGEAGVPGRLYFRKRGVASFNIHIVHFGGAHWTTNLAVRDYLRAHSETIREYAAAKRQAVKGSPCLLEYSRRKAGFIEDLVRGALAWALESRRRRQS